MTPERAARLRALTVAADNARHAWDDARTARDQEIEAADLDGESIRGIARASGLSPGYVDRLVAARTATRQERLLEAGGLAA